MLGGLLLLIAKDERSSVKKPDSSFKDTRACEKNITDYTSIYIRQQTIQIIITLTAIKVLKPEVAIGINGLH